MFSFTPVAIAFMLMLLPGWLAESAFVHARPRLVKAILSAGVAGAAYCVLAGVQMLSGWVDPLADASSGALARASVQGGGKGGLIVMVIRYLPYFLCHTF
jgi:hypothetical protein